MKDAAEYLAYIKALVIKNSQIRRWHVVREEVQKQIGLFRYRLFLSDESLLELFERFEVIEEHVLVKKYSFHWQDKDGRLRKRWDNAPHYPNVNTFPHHVHEYDDAQVLPHNPVTVQDILEVVLMKNIKG